MSDIQQCRNMLQLCRHPSIKRLGHTTVITVIIFFDNSQLLVELWSDNSLGLQQCYPFYIALKLEMTLNNVHSIRLSIHFIATFGAVISVFVPRREQSFTHNFSYIPLFKQGFRLFIVQFTLLYNKFTNFSEFQ